MAQAVVREFLSEISLEDMMSKTILSVHDEWSVKKLAGFFVDNNISGAPVISESKELVGVVTQSDVVQFESRTLSEEELKEMMEHIRGPFSGDLTHDDIEHLRDKASENSTVHSIMTPKVVSVDISTTITEACAVIVEKKIHRLFITEDGKLVGVITAHDVLQKLLGI